jgi:aryl-alcohol dehydrogenase-like predicted oxidoreductase
VRTDEYREDLCVKTRQLGDSGIKVSEIGVGTMQFGAAGRRGQSGWGGPGEDECCAIADEAIRLGATFIDTAPSYAYGRSEEILGKVLQGRRDQVVLCTKFGVWSPWPDVTVDHSADRIEESVEASLRRLQTDYIDVLLFHGLPREDRERVVGQGAKVLQRLVDSGTIRTYGLSYAPESVEELHTLVELTGCTCLEFRFNVLHQDPRSIFTEAARLGVGLIINIPLESGWLSGNYTASSEFDGPRSRWSPSEIARRTALVEEYRSLLPSGVSTPHGALSFILAQTEVSTIVPGTKSVAHLRNNAAAADVVLPQQALAAIRELGTNHAANSLPW